MAFERWILGSCSPGLYDSPSGWKMGNGVYGFEYFSALGTSRYLVEA